MSGVAVRLKWLFASSMGGSWGADQGGDAVDALCVRGTDFDYRRLRVDISRAPTRSFGSAEFANRSIRRGDVVIEKSGGGEQQPVGRAVLWDQEAPAVPTNFAARLRPREDVDPRFVTYLLASMWSDGLTRSVIKQTTGIQNLDLSALLDLRVAAPAFDEQRAIADYLDRETARIDALISAQERMMRLLADQRDAYLSATLWQGNYRPVRLKFLTTPPTSGNRDHASFAPTDDGVPCLRGLNVRAGWIDRENLLRLSPDDHARHLGTRLHEGDVVVVRSGLAGAAAAIPANLEDCNCVDLVIIRRSPKLVPKYLEQVINSREAREQVAQRSVGALLTHFNAVDAADLVVPFRDLAEQEQIVDGIDEFDERYLRMRASLDRQVNLLQERRQSLITAAVTGEIKVPGAA